MGNDTTAPKIKNLRKLSAAISMAEKIFRLEEVQLSELNRIVVFRFTYVIYDESNQAYSCNERFIISENFSIYNEII